MSSFTAFLDANVLHPAELRSLLMYLAVSELFRARWSNDVHEEWISSVLKRRPDINREKLERTRNLMDMKAPDALVSGYERLIPDLDLPDPNDRHVLAAAILGRADVIVTNNIKDFPAEVLDGYNIEAQTPDEFVYHLINLYPNQVLGAVEDHRSSMLHPPMNLDEYLDCLRLQGLTDSCQALRELIER
jgi:predicted nucleic acid-binding protein